jgi:hypothetical protein
MSNTTVVRKSLKSLKNREFVKEALVDRYNYCYDMGWVREGKPQAAVFDYLVDKVVVEKTYNNFTAIEIVDNFCINSEMCFLDNYRKMYDEYDDMSDKKLIKSLRDECEVINTEEGPVVVMSWGF